MFRVKAVIRTKFLFDEGLKLRLHTAINRADEYALVHVIYVQR